MEKGYTVHGLVRRSSTERFERIEHLRSRITLHQADLLDHRSLVDALRAAKPDEIYNLAAMSFVAVSWIQPTLTAEFTGVGVTRLRRCSIRSNRSVEERLTKPCTSYPRSSRNSARYEPSCPVIPVISADGMARG